MNRFVVQYLAVEETVEKRNKETLEGGEKVGREGPNGEFFGRAIERCWHHDESVGDS